MSEHSSRGSAWRAVRLAVLNRDNWTCQHCGKPGLEGDDATADHIIPKAVWFREGRTGNPDTPDNCIASCRSCNSSRQDDEYGPRINYYNPRWFTQHT